jgi:hypothetical protein
MAICVVNTGASKFFSFRLNPSHNLLMSFCFDILPLGKGFGWLCSLQDVALIFLPMLHALATGSPIPQ